MEGKIMEITLERIRNIAYDIKSDDSWVNDSHSLSEYQGIISGLNMLIKHLEENTKYGEK